MFSNLLGAASLYPSPDSEAQETTQAQGFLRTPQGSVTAVTLLFSPWPKWCPSLTKVACYSASPCSICVLT